MIFDHQKALKYYRNVLNEFSGLFQILNLKKTEISDALKGGFEMIRLNRNLDEKKYIKVTFKKW